MKIKRKSIAFGAIAILLIIAAALTSVLAPQRKRLLDRATRVTDAPENSSAMRLSAGNGARYAWLSDTQAVGMTYHGYEDHAFVLDTATGTRTPIPRLETTFATVTPSGEQHLSPDRRRLLWNGIRNSLKLPAAYGKRRVPPTPGRSLFDSFRVVATAIDGSRQVDWQQGNDLAWLPNSKGWARLVRHPMAGGTRYSVQIQTLLSPQKVETVIPGLTLWNGEVKVLGMRADNHLIIGCLPDGITQRNGRAQIVDIAPAKESPVVHSYSVALPVGLTIRDVALSPTGNRLAWTLIGARRTVPLVAARMLPFLKDTHQPIISLWVSNLDGSKLREIGNEDAPRIDGWDERLYDLSWTPSGNRLSFIFGGALWTVPAD